MACNTCRLMLRTSNNFQGINYFRKLGKLVPRSVAYGVYNNCRLYSDSAKNSHSQDFKTAKIKLDSLIVPGQSNENVIDLYNIQGKVYDQSTQVVDYNAPKQTAETVSSILQDFKDAKILDAGCGSGQAGMAIRDAGFTKVDGTDGSSQQLKIAQESKVYKNTFCHLLGTEPLPIKDDTYDMVVMTGVMGNGHVPKEAMDDLCRVVKPGGHIVNVFREPALHVPYYGEGLEPYFNQLEEQGKWRLIERRTFPNFMKDKHGVDIEGLVFVHRIE